MNLHLISYSIFFPAMIFIAMVVAQVCHKHGRIWMLRIFDGETEFVDTINNILLLGCYTVDLGYVALIVSQWEQIVDLPDLLNILSDRIGTILFSLAGLHYTNITVLLVWSHKKKVQHAVPPNTTNAQHRCM